jgi:hypothetical protein
VPTVKVPASSNPEGAFTGQFAATESSPKDISATTTKTVHAIRIHRLFIAPPFG